MNLYRQNNGLYRRWMPRSGRKRLFFATIFIIILFVFDAISGGKLRVLARGAGSSVWGLGVSVQESIHGSGFLSTRRGLISENTVLAEQIARLQERSAAYQMLKDENEVFREMLHVAGGVQGRDKKSGITAPIISSLRASSYGTFQVGAGFADSVAAGDLVLSAENFVIGRVAEADSHTSLVSGIFASGVFTDAVIRGVAVTVEGQGGGNARTTMPRLSEVAVGDAVISAVLGARGIGVVGNIAENSGSAYKSVNIYLPVNLSALKFVYIVKN